MIVVITTDGRDYGLKRGLVEIAGMTVEMTEDYSVRLNGLPKSNVLKCGCSPIRNRAETEDIYISVTVKDRTAVEVIEKEISAELEKRMK